MSVSNDNPPQQQQPQPSQPQATPAFPLTFTNPVLFFYCTWKGLTP